MRNKAKCKICGTILSPEEGVISTCVCGEITLNGMDKRVICDTKTENYIEVDDEGNEIIIQEKQSPHLTKVDLLKIMDEMIKNIEDLPTHAMQMPISHYDLVSSLYLIRSLFKV